MGHKRKNKVLKTHTIYHWKDNFMLNNNYIETMISKGFLFKLLSILWNKNITITLKKYFFYFKKMANSAFMIRDTFLVKQHKNMFLIICVRILHSIEIKNTTHICFFLKNNENSCCGDPMK